MRVLQITLTLITIRDYNLNIAPTVYSHIPDVHASIHVASMAAC